MPSISTCPELQVPAQFVLDQLSSKEAKTITRHMSECDRCLATVDNLKDGGKRRRLRRAALAQPAAEPVQGRLDELEAAVPSEAAAAHRNPQQPIVPAELPAKSTSPAWLVIGFALVAALSFVCFSYASDIARFFERTMSPSHVEKLAR